jgi:tetratricopeptide (TPR) repeat protein
VNYGVGFDTADYMRESYAPMLSLAHVRTGDRRLAEGDTAAGERSYRAALNVVELNGMAHRQLGALYAQLGRPRDALAEFTEALRCYRRFHYPYWEYGEDITYRHLYNLRLQFGDTATAVAVLRQAARAHPQIAETRLALAWRLATIPDDRLRSADEALEHAEAARRLMPESNVQTLDVLAAAYAEAGHFEQAASTAAAALELARHNHQQAAQIAARLAAYRNHQPWRARPGLMHIPRSDW